MSHTVWKLTALAVVVALGVAVVIQAQRGMQEADPNAEKEIAASLEQEGPGGDLKDPLDDSELPTQGEPEMTADEDSIAPGASIAGRGMAPRAKASVISTEDDELALNETAVDERARAPVREAAAAGDPFGDGDLEPDADVDELAIEPQKNAPEAAKPRPGKKAPGPVLILDAPDEDEEHEKTAVDGREPKGAAAGPKLLGATDEEPATPVKTKPVKADPFEEEEDIPALPATSKAPAKIADDEDDELLKDLDTAPAPLPRAALESKPKPVARDPFQEDEERDEQPALPDDEEAPRPAPNRKRDTPVIPKGIEDEDDPLAKPARTVKPLLPDSNADSSPRDLESPPPRRSVPPALPQLDEPIPEETPPPKPELPKLSIEKVAPPTAVLGKPMVYQILVRNTGEIPAHQVVVEDAIPEGLKIDGSIPQAQLKENHLIWKLGTIPAGREKKISVRVIPQSEGAIGSVATLNFSPLPPPPANPTAPQLTFKVDAPRQAAVGTPIEFSFRVKNVGAVPATGVTIRDVLPSGLHHADGDDLEYEIGKIAPGKTSEVKLVLTAAQAGPTVNRVVVTADGNVSEAAEVQLDVVAPALAVSRGGPKQVYPGKVGRFTNTVANSGAGQVSQINLVETVPAGMEFVEASDGGSYNAAKRTVAWTIDRLNAGEAKTVKVSLRSAARGPQISVVRASDHAGTNAETIGTTLVAGVPALKIEVGELPALVEVGEVVKISVRIVNRGTDVATGVRAAVPVPSGLKFLSATGPVEYRQEAVSAEEGAPRAMQIEFAPIGKIDTKGEVAFELTFKGRAPGETHFEVDARCDQMTEPIHSRDALMIALPE